MSEEKINALEEIVAHQEQQISDLNDIVTKQWNEIDALKKKIVRLGDKVEEIGEATKDSEDGLSVSEEAALNKPPHY